jgi:hypothetical protein
MPHAVVAPVRRRAVGGEEEGDAGHVVADAKPTQPAQDDGSEEEGDAEHVAADEGLTQPAQRKKITAREWACYHMHDRNPTSHALFVYGKRLYQEWGVDQYSKVESQWLFYIRNNQGPLRVFVGKLQHLLDELLKKGIFGEVVANIHVIEWQKKGLPHAHILLILHSDHKPRGPDEYDRMVSTKLPDKDAHPTFFEVVTSCMVHGPCGTINPHCTCMADGVCSKGYPKAFTEHTTDTTDSYPTYRRRDDGRTFER